MDVYKAFLMVLLLVFEFDAAEAPVGRKRTSSWDKPSTDHIPILSSPTNTIYKPEYLSDGWLMNFYSKNLHVEPQSLHNKVIIRDQHKLTMVKSAHYSVDQGVHFMEAIQQTARDHIKFYADYWHGKMQSKNHKAYKTFEDKMKQLRSDKIGTAYQLNARMETTDGPLQMCCNMIINTIWERDIDYAFQCAEPACFRINQRLNEAPCFYLDIIPGALDSIHYKSCIKEIPFKDPKDANHHTSHPSPTSTGHHGLPRHSSSVYAKTCQFDDRDVEVTFLSKNLDLDGVILAYPKITRNRKLISFKKDTRIVDKDRLNEHDNHMDDVALSHIEVYADVMHGIWNQTHTVTVVEKKRVTTHTSDVIYQLSTRVRSSSEPTKEMCCNVLLRSKWHGGNEYEPYCAQVACFNLLEGLGTCAYLNMEHQINPGDFKSCWKEVK